MPIGPTPATYHCPKCHWQALFAPKSDVLMQMPWDECPKCGCRELIQKPAGALDLFVEELNQVFRKQ